MHYFRLTALVVDDSPTMRKIVRNHLGVIGVKTVVEAGDGRQAVDVMRSFRPDVIVSDWDMAPMNGTALLSYVRSSPLLGKVPFVMATAHMVRFRDAGRDGGLTHYLQKPFRPEDLKERIDLGLSAAGVSRKVA